MPHKLPLAVRQVFSKHKHTLVCDICGQPFPKDTSIEALMAHKASHDSPAGQKLYNVVRHPDGTIIAERSSMALPTDKVEMLHDMHYVRIHAANQKHAEIKGQRMIYAHINQPQDHRRVWRT